MAALTLSLRDGYDLITTEAIATEAGISTRTFFNYYPNKQAAVLGRAVTLSDVAPDWFTASGTDLTGDLVRLLFEALQNDPPDREMLRLILRVIDAQPALAEMFRKRLDDMALVLSGLLQQRLGADRETEARLLAELSIHALAQAVSIWAIDDRMQMEDITPQMKATLQSVGHLLCGGDAQIETVIS